MAELPQSVRGLGVGSSRFIILGVVGAIFLAVFVALSFKLTSPVMSPLYGNLTTDDAGAIAGELGAMGIDFQIANNGSEIMAPSSEILNIRMLLAQKGLPNRGSIVGYEVFDSSDGLGTSSFVHNVNLMRALEGELSRTISSFSTIKSARVHLVVPRREVFKRSKVEPSASVVLTLASNKTLPKEQIFAVSHLVATAVPGMKSSNITVVDSNGNLLARGETDAESEQANFSAGKAQEFKVTYEKNLRNTIESILEKTVGIGSVKAEVSADIAFDRITTSSENYDPDGQVARSIQSTSETEMVRSPEQTVGVASNLPEGDAVVNGSSSSPSSEVERIDEVTNFEISKTITNRVSEVGVVQKLSVAVLVDGRYVEDEEGNQTYVPRTDEEIEQLQTLVRSAIGFNAQRGDTVEVVNMQFSNDYSNLVPEEGTFDFIASDLNSIIKTLVIGVVAILGILLVIRPLVVKAFDMGPDDDAPTNAGSEDLLSGGDIMGAGAGAMAASSNFSVDLSEIQSQADSSPSSQINQIADSNPEATLDIIRTWMQTK